MKALEIKRQMLASIDELHLQEDEVREHGLLAHAREEGLCAPDGTCLEGDVFVTVLIDQKMLQIEANPIFTRNVIAELQASQNGKHSPIMGIAPDSAIVSFQVLSVGPHRVVAPIRAIQ